MYVPPRELVVFEDDHWRINHRVDARLPGYLIMAPRDSAATSFSTIQQEALAEMGFILARIMRVVEEKLNPRHLYVGRYGHTGGHPLHLHVIPVYDWLVKALSDDARYRGLRAFDTSGVWNSGQEIGFDGAERTLFIWREFCEGKAALPPNIASVEEVVSLLRHALA